MVSLIGSLIDPLIGFQIFKNFIQDNFESVFVTILLRSHSSINGKLMTVLPNVPITCSFLQLVCTLVEAATHLSCTFAGTTTALTPKAEKRY